MTYTHWAFGDYPAALDTIVADNDPFRAMVLSILNRPEEALASLDESARRAVGYPIHEAYVELVRATVLNQPAAFQSSIDRLLESTFRDPEGFIYLAIFAMWMKNSAVALACLTRAVDQGCACFPHLDREPAFQPLRGETEFGRLLAETERRHREALAAFTVAGGPAIL